MCRNRIEETLRSSREVDRRLLRRHDTGVHFLSVDDQSFPLCDHISRQAPPVVHRVHAGCVVGGSVGGAGADETPIETCITDLSEDHT